MVSEDEGVKCNPKHINKGGFPFVEIKNEILIRHPILKLNKYVILRSLVARVFIKRLRYKAKST